MNLIKRFAGDLFIIYEDDSVQQKSRKLSLRWTVIVWVFLCAVGVFINLKPVEPEFKEIRITLSSEKAMDPIVPQTIKPENPPAPEAAAPKQTAVPQATSQPAKPTESKPSVQKTPEPKYTISKPQTFAKSTEELMAEQLSSSKTEKSWDDSMFEGSSETVSSKNTATSPAVKKISESESVKGTAATAASTESATASSATSRSASASSSSASASGDTKSALDAISSVKPTPYSSVSGNGTSSTSLVSSTTAGGGVSIAMTNGTVRRLLDPKEPIIKISDESAKLIEASKTVTITFKVLAAGTVPLSSIQISPASSLVSAVQSEIKNQIARWRFATDPSESTATFEYSIIKK